MLQPVPTAEKALLCSLNQHWLPATRQVPRQALEGRVSTELPYLQDVYIAVMLKVSN